MNIFNVTGGEKEQDRTLQSHDDSRGGMLNNDDILKSASFQLRPQSNGKIEEETKVKVFFIQFNRHCSGKGCFQRVTRRCRLS
jgi:hypothetical protein